MRYQNWDVLVFPDESRIPMQEFKTTCHVIQDPEPRIRQPLPVVTSFIPSLQAGEAFRISIHSWHIPELSSLEDGCNMFQARLFVDGQIVGAQSFDHEGPWPSIIEHLNDSSNKSEPDKIPFPTFHRELLSQSYWNAADDLGRIKVILSEGIVRDGRPYEWVRNIVSFSFQHAPLELLETASIAWPNPAMFRAPLVPVLNGAMKAQGYSRHPSENVASVHRKVVAYDPFTIPDR